MKRSAALRALSHQHLQGGFMALQLKRDELERLGAAFVLAETDHE